MYILIAILVFGFLVLIHEFGHFIAARIFHVRIFEYAIGMGPSLISYTSKKSGIQYGIRMFLFGGYVSMQGEMDEDENIEQILKERKVQPTEDQSKMGALASKPAWQRLIVHLAGPFMNLLFGFIAALILTLIMNVGTTQVARFDIPEGESVGYTQSQGLQEGDIIYKVGNKRVHISDELYYEISHQATAEEPLVLTVIRGGEKIELPISFYIIEESGVTIGEVDFYVYAEQKDFGVVLKQAFYKSKYLVQVIVESIVDLVKGKYSLDSVSGPVATTSVISTAAKSGFPTLLYITALISVNLGIFNVLPLPALDGGHIFCTLFELITRKKVSGKIIAKIDGIGLIILLGIMVLVTIKDIIGLF